MKLHIPGACINSATSLSCRGLPSLLIVQYFSTDLTSNLKSLKYRLHAIVKVQKFSMFPMGILGRAASLPKSLFGSVKKKRDILGPVDSTIVVLELWHRLHMAYPHAHSAYTHWRCAARGIMRMRSPSCIFSTMRDLRYLIRFSRTDMDSRVTCKITTFYKLDAAARLPYWLPYILVSLTDVW